MKKKRDSFFVFSEQSIPKRKNKKGQFYLAAAIIISSLIIGIAVISNYIQREDTTRVYALGEEIKIESAMVLDYALYNGLGENDFYKKLSDFTDNYVKNYKVNNDIYFLFGSKNNMTVKGHQNIGREVILSSGDKEILVTSVKGFFEGSINPEENEIFLYLDDLKYSFELKSNRNFYFVLVERVSENEYIITG